MPEPIKNKVIDAIVDQLGTIQAPLYDYDFTAVHRAKPIIKPGEISVWPRFHQPEEQHFSETAHQLEMRVLAQVAVSKTENADEKGTYLEANLIECIFGESWALAYTAGDSGGADPDGMLGLVVLIGAVSFSIESYTITAGSWEAGTAVGVLTIRRLVGTYTATPLPLTITDFGIFVGGTMTQNDYQEAMFTPLKVIGIDYVASGIETYPEADDTAVTVALDILIRFATTAGNPYRQD